MKTFIKYFTIWIVVSFLFLEIILRVFNLAAMTLPEVNIEGDLLLKSSARGEYVNGGFGEIRADYKINKEGFNSIIDYSDSTPDSLKIAIIGNSFIEGLRNPVESSIGRLIEKMQNNKMVVYEYGRSGGNIVDYSFIYKKYKLEHYKKVFVLITDGTLFKVDAAFMGKGEKVARNSLLRKIYSNIYLVRYFNINHGMLTKMRSLFKKNNRKISEKKNSKVNKINFQALKIFNDNTVFLYEKDRIPIGLLMEIRFSILEIKHDLKPYTYGFDRHWNLNGNINCAKSIHDFLQESNRKMK